MELSGRKALVVGLGRTGDAVARFLHARGARVTANDLRKLDELPSDARTLADLGIVLELGGHPDAIFVGADLIVVSPGVPRLAALATAERKGVPIMSEVELAARFVKGAIVGITGTNGKSTVTELTGEMCRRSGRATFVGGNLGTPLIEAVGSDAAEPGGVLVVELSSFQLERVSELHVNAATLLNVTEDHLDRYDSFEAYASAKGAIFERQTSDDLAVVPNGDARCEALAARGRARVRRFGGKDGDARVERGALCVPDLGLELPLSEVGLTGGHNYDNAGAATLLSQHVGVGVTEIAAVLRGFAGLPHRMQQVAVLQGVAFFDDSKATNVGASVAALDGLSARDGRVVLIAGGKDKGGSYAPLVERMRALGRAVVLIGEAAPLIEQAFAGSAIPCARAADMSSAVREARDLAQPGDAVLLAPACSSFDMYRSYAHRGDVFQAAVRALAQTAQEGGAA